MKKTGYRRNLIRQVAKNRKRIEKQFSLLAEKGTSHEFERAQNEKFRLLESSYGSIKQPTRIKTAGLEKILELQKKTISSKFFTLKGRKEVTNKSFETLKRRSGFEGMSQKGFNLFTKLLTDRDLLGGIKEKYYLSSDQVLELARDHTEKELVDAFNKLGDFLERTGYRPSPRETMALVKTQMAGKDIEDIYEKLQGVQSLGSN